MKFRRKSDAPHADQPVEQADPAGTAAAAVPTEPGAPAQAATDGPYDADALPEDGVDRVDLGSLLIAPVPGLELRLQVDEKSGAVQAVLLANPDGAVELRAFAAPRHGDLWSEVRPQIAADMAQRGGVASEREGVFGPELTCQLTVRRPDGSTATQPSRVIGVNGERWLLRASVMGRPALADELPQEWVDAIRSVAVRRGTGAMPVGEPLPVVLPENARRIQPAAEAQSAAERPPSS
ncbi:DUF3710 domain-containing protein [Nocardioides dongkuii]|uniref:DUF3710 domain-containing protein n=1 Tax=Nocardioides dongkuii TaxID=2760089 RepID=UPI0015F8EFDA|nr:DUF3710 domain-containing protein [Nocardioides dongkuii]